MKHPLPKRVGHIVLRAEAPVAQVQFAEAR
jgi:hypothetical protein